MSILLNYYLSGFCISILFYLFQAPEGETQPSTEVDLFISTEKIMVLNTDLKASKYVTFYFNIYV